MPRQQIVDPVTSLDAAQTYALIEKAIAYLEANYQRQPSLAELSARIGLSEFHFQRLFSRWAGVSPKKFVQYLALDHAKAAMAKAQSVLAASHDAGLSGPGRMHDLFVTFDAVTPGEFKARGRGLAVTYGFHPTPFGECLLARTERGICHLAFLNAGGRTAAMEGLRGRWERAELAEDAAGAEVVERIFGAGGESGTAAEGARGGGPLRLLLRGTNFQIKVWEALLRIPFGAVTSYAEVAAHIGSPGAARAVGGAVGANEIAYLIPCHRVIRKLGLAHDYRWGAPRKKAMLAWEAARATGVSD